MNIPTYFAFFLQHDVQVLPVRPVSEGPVCGQPDVAEDGQGDGAHDGLGRAGHLGAADQKRVFEAVEAKLANCK